MLLLCLTICVTHLLYAAFHANRHTMNQQQPPTGPVLLRVLQLALQHGYTHLLVLVMMIQMMVYQKPSLHYRYIRLCGRPFEGHDAHSMHVI